MCLCVDACVVWRDGRTVSVLGLPVWWCFGIFLRKRFGCPWWFSCTFYFIRRTHEASLIATNVLMCFCTDVFFVIIIVGINK